MSKITGFMSEFEHYLNLTIISLNLSVKGQAKPHSKIYTQPG